MRSIAPWFLVMFIAYAIQSSLLYPFAYAGTSADLIMILVITLSIMYDKYALLFGFSGGLFQDLASGSFLGIHAFTLIILCLVASYLSHFIYRDNPVIPLCIGVFATMGNHLIVNTLIYLLGYKILIMPAIKATIISVIYNIIFGYLLWYICHKIRSFIDRRLSRTTSS